MTDIPKRDITGECEGECRDRVNESNQERQVQMKKMKTKSPSSYPSVPGASDRNEPPGFFGGHA